MDWMKLAPHRSNRYNEAAGERVTIATHVVSTPLRCTQATRHATPETVASAVLSSRHSLATKTYLTVTKDYRVMSFGGKLIVLHRERRQSEDNGGGGVDGEGRETLMDVMLSLQNSDPERYTIFRYAMFSAGTDSSADTTEWAMSLLLNHPHVLEKAATEFNMTVGHERPISEDDLLNLAYLNCIIHESLRLYPATPLLAPHETFNAWAIHRDVDLWDEPEKFKPERFMAGEVVEGYKFMPFGMGRRRLGVGLSIRMVALMLATFVQCLEALYKSR
ncbi:cytochrome P450 81Q32-like [Zingiber officinale]|uniref:Cytochrome P450 n=1 Tax=Zingiber officinale TaxID=94328 RepID=A0A8J5EAR2_ZINOF|nr:cytochrome P450 81Q32-like [Zingiber officinale]KAG6469380.1 hypothetical protein ZIOFF_074095 [Zingiber officinale]